MLNKRELIIGAAFSVAPLPALASTKPTLDRYVEMLTNHFAIPQSGRPPPISNEKMLEMNKKFIARRPDFFDTKTLMLTPNSIVTSKNGPVAVASKTRVFPSKFYPWMTRDLEHMAVVDAEAEITEILLCEFVACIEKEIHAKGRVWCPYLPLMAFRAIDDYVAFKTRYGEIDA